eukprot:5644824-Alexandrium_andersonii.AAC.1
MCFLLASFACVVDALLLMVVAPCLAQPCRVVQCRAVPCCARQRWTSEIAELCRVVSCCAKL